MTGRRRTPGRLARLWRRFSPLLVLAGAMLVAVIVSLLLSTREAEQQTEVVAGQRDATAEQAERFAQQLLAACADDSDAAEQLRELGLCGQARRVADNPVPPIPGTPGEPGAAGPGVSDAQVGAAVAEYLRRNPPPAGRPPTTVEIAAAAVAYLTANPPEPGRPPTAVEIAAAVRAYVDANPPAPGRDGMAGVDGQPGRAPTGEEIRAAVDAALADNPPPPGPAGPQGVGVQSVRAEQRDGQCVLVFVLADPATGATAEQAVPVPDGICDGGLLG